MDKKKLAAAIAAVYANIKTSEEAMACAAAQPEEAAPAAAVISHVDVRPYNTWGITGRQAGMQANAMMQMRMFK